MSTRDFQQIQMIRRLIRAERYHEARMLLREIHNAQVPILEQQLDDLIAANTRPASPHPIFSPFSIKLGLVTGFVMMALMLCSGITSVPFVVACFMICFLVGAILPEYTRRREESRERIRRIIHKRHNDRLKRGY